jgi:hypothetical protein
VNIALLFCEDAVARPDGKLDINGIFNELYASGFPARQERVIIAGIIEWERSINGKQPFVIHLKDPDEKPIFTIDGYTDVCTRHDDQAPARTHLILPLENLIFPSVGEYQLHMEILDQQFLGPSLYLIASEQRKNNL